MSLLDLPLSTHAEEPDLVAGGVMHEGAVSAELGLPGRPALAEDVVVARDLVLAEATGGQLHVGHVSSARSVAMVRRARARGVPVTAEVTPHHLMLQDEDLRSLDPHLRVNPPLRTSHDRAALRAGLRDGTLDCVATDHAPHAPAEKARPFSDAPPGMIGLETALGLLLKLVGDGELTLARAMEVLTVGPALCFGLDAGTLAPGARADITLVDLDATVTVDPARLRSLSRNTPFGGWSLPGQVVRTIVGGRTVYTA